MAFPLGRSDDTDTGKAAGFPADAHESEPSGAGADSIKAGHEPDRFRVSSILYVPLIMVVSVLTAFTVVTLTFNAITTKAPVDATGNPTALAESQKPFNSRIAAISSTDANAKVNQPRLEYLKQTAGTDDPKDPPFYRSKRPIEATGATWELRPEDLRPENFVDPTLKRKILIEAGWQDDAKKVAHIPIDEAMRAVLASNKLAIAKGAVGAPSMTDGKPKLSNSGRGGPSQPADPASPPRAGGKTENKPAEPHP